MEGKWLVFGTHGRTNVLVPAIFGEVLRERLPDKRQGDINLSCFY